MQSRIELKSQITVMEAIRLLSVLKEVCLPDQHQVGLGGYQVSSLYLDTYSLSEYFAKKWGSNEKEKYRLRFYNFEDKLHAESKYKMDKGIYKKKFRSGRIP